jgi:hypothetical protein
MKNEIAPDDKELVKDRLRRLFETPEIEEIARDISVLRTLHSAHNDRPSLEIKISRAISKVVEVLLK